MNTFKENERIVEIKPDVLRYVIGRDYSNLYFLQNKTIELPTNILSISKNRNKKQIINSIYKNIFLDKKRIGKFPRIINIKKINSPKIVEMKSLDKIKQTISKVLFNKVK